MVTNIPDVLVMDAADTRSVVLTGDIPDTESAVLAVGVVVGVVGWVGPGVGWFGRADLQVAGLPLL